jgi:integrase
VPTESGRQVSEAIACYHPRSFPPEVAAFARGIVAVVAPASPARARALLFAAAKLADFARHVGLELEVAVLFAPSVIERFIGIGCRDVTPATRRTLRTNLRHLAASCTSEPRPVALPRERAKPPYSPAEISSYLGLCDTQPTALRRARSNALICLGAGAGLVGTELRQMRGSDVVSRSGGVLVEVKGRRPRAVPVLAAYHERLCAAAGFFGSRYLVSGTNPNSHNVTNPLITALSGGLDLKRLDTGRLRSTYLAESARQIGLAAFMEAAGISCSQRLGDLLSHLESPSEEDAVALLGARQTR